MRFFVFFSVLFMYMKKVMVRQWTYKKIKWARESKRSRAGALLRLLVRIWRTKMCKINCLLHFFRIFVRAWLKSCLIITILILFFLKILSFDETLNKNQSNPQNKEICVDFKRPLHRTCIHRNSPDSPIRVKVIHLFTKYFIQTFLNTTSKCMCHKSYTFSIVCYSKSWLQKSAHTFIRCCLTSCMTFSNIHIPNVYAMPQ